MAVFDWQDEIERRRLVQAAGRVQVLRVHGRLHVVAPYNRDFIDLARKLGGDWKPNALAWSFPVAKRAEVLAAVKRIYNVGDEVACEHRWLKIEGGIKCLHCGAFRERGK